MPSNVFKDVREHMWKEQIKDDGTYYFLLDEVHMFSEFISVYDGN